MLSLMLSLMPSLMPSLHFCLFSRNKRSTTVTKQDGSSEGSDASSAAEPAPIDTLLCATAS